MCILQKRKLQFQVVISVSNHVPFAKEALQLPAALLVQHQG